MSNSTEQFQPVPLLDIPRKDVVDFGGLDLTCYPQMMYPNEVRLYEPTIDHLPSPSQRGTGSSSISMEKSISVPLPCGHFNIWRPLHDKRTPISQRFSNFFSDSPSLSEPPSNGSSDDNTSKWDSRVSYSSVDDEYYENGMLLPYIKQWLHGTLFAQNVFHKREFDWNKAYLAHNDQGGPGSSLIVWRFNYAESKRAVEKFHAVLNFAVFDETAAVQWYVRPLSKLEFVPVPIHILTADEARHFTEISSTTANGSSSSSSADAEKRAQIIDRYCGQILAYEGEPDGHNEYNLHSVPNLAADLSQYTDGEYGFEVAVALFGATEGEDRWQKAQIARQDTTCPVSGRTREGEDAVRRCGLDFRIKLRDDIEVDDVVVKEEDCRKYQMDGPDSDFTIRISDPSNTIGSFQPPIRAHEQVLASGSDYFVALLASPMEESETKQVTFNDISYGSARLAINYLYTGTIPYEKSMTLEDWTALMEVSTRLSIARLFQYCQARVLCNSLSDIRLESNSHGIASYPEPDIIEHLGEVARSTGAEALEQVLDRRVAYYPIEVCEQTIREEPTNNYIPRQSVGSFASPGFGREFRRRPRHFFARGGADQPNDGEEEEEEEELNLRDMMNFNGNEGWQELLIGRPGAWRLVGHDNPNNNNQQDQEEGNGSESE